MTTCSKVGGRVKCMGLAIPPSMLFFTSCLCHSLSCANLPLYKRAPPACVPADMRVKRGRKRTPWSEVFEPYTAADYHSMLGEATRNKEGLGSKVCCTMLTAWCACIHAGVNERCEGLVLGCPFNAPVTCYACTGLHACQAPDAPTQLCASKVDGRACGSYGVHCTSTCLHAPTRLAHSGPVCGGGGGRAAHASIDVGDG